MYIYIYIYIYLHFISERKVELSSHQRYSESDGREPFGRPTCLRSPSHGSCTFSCGFLKKTEERYGSEEDRVKACVHVQT
jgi:hypothetical protein